MGGSPCFTALLPALAVTSCWFVLRCFEFASALGSPPHGLLGAAHHGKVALDQPEDRAGQAGPRNVVAAQFAVFVEIDDSLVAQRGQVLRYVRLLDAEQFLDYDDTNE